MEWVQGEAKICRFCGATFKSIEEVPTTSSTSLNASLVSLPTANRHAGSIKSENKVAFACLVFASVIFVLYLFLDDWRNNLSRSFNDHQAAVERDSTANKVSQQTESPLLILSGNGSKSTQVVTVPEEWRLDWTYDCADFGQKGNFQVWVYNSDGSFSRANSVNQLGIRGSDTEYYHRGGRLYFEINSVCRWTIKVIG